MRKNFLKLTSMLASCAMLATAIVPVSVHATPLVFDQMTEKNGVYSGVIGGHFAGDTPNRWEVDGNVLTLSGQYFYGWNETGCLDAWSDSYIPWYQFCDQIDTIRFKDFNISCMNTDMGAYVYNGLDHLKAIYVDEYSLSNVEGQDVERYRELLNRADTVYAQADSFADWCVRWSDTTELVTNGTDMTPFYTRSGQLSDTVSWRYDDAERTLWIEGSGTASVNLDACNQIAVLKDGYDKIKVANQNIRIPSSLLIRLMVNQEDGTSEKTAYLYRDTFRLDGSSGDTFDASMLEHYHCSYVLQDAEIDTTIRGDVNLDGSIDLTDAVMLGKIISGSVEMNDQQKVNADCTKDGSVTTDDTQLLMQFLMHNVEAL